jgi:hypothetical protein
VGDPTDIGGREWDQPESNGKLRIKMCPKIVGLGVKKKTGSMD